MLASRLLAFAALGALLGAAAATGPTTAPSCPIFLDVADFG